MPKARLVELFAHGLGVIEDARLEFGAGFNVITGETGAGKTLLIDALGLCLGADTTSTRYALTTETKVVALFSRDERDTVFAREASASGRLRSSLDGAPSSAEALSSLAEGLITIHGQHDSLSLRSRAEIVRLVDVYGAVDDSELTEVRQRITALRREHEAEGGDEASRERELEFEVFQLRELDGAVITSPEELAVSLEQLTRLTSLRDSQVALDAALRTFDGEVEDSVLARYAQALSNLPDGAAYDEARDLLTGALVQAREALSDLAALANPEVYDSTVLAALEDRCGVLQSMARKYGSLEAALASRDELERSIERRRGSAERLNALDQELQRLGESERALARRVRHDREYAATALTNAVRAQLPRVALTGASLRVVVDGDDGSDAQILFTPNPGLPEGPLAALASGGELSRVLLALSLETAREDVVAVFDEIDAGLGGQVAQQIGECLQEVGRRQQVLAITHLASVAARADHHFVIEKTISHGRTNTTVRALHGKSRVLEIARMLAGDEVSDASTALARQLIENSRQVAPGVTAAR